MKIEFADINTLQDETYESYRQMVSAECLERASRFRFEKDRRLTVTGEYLARKLLSDELGISSDKIVIKRTAKGKPFAECPLRFNISHSGEVAAVALSNSEIGVDIEKIRTPEFKTMRKFCTENEKKYIDDAATDNERQVRFFEIWTLKEAYLKCRGDGIIGGMMTAEFKIENGKAVCSDEKYSCRLIYEISGYIVSVCELL